MDQIESCGVLWIDEFRRTVRRLRAKYDTADAEPAVVEPADEVVISPEADRC